MGDEESEFGIGEVFTELYTAAVGMHELFESYIAAGFTEAQAMELIGRLMTASIQNRGDES